MSPHHSLPSHVDVVVGCELQIDRLDAGQSQDGDVDVDQQRISSPGAGTQLVGINLRNLEKLIFHKRSCMISFEKLSLDNPSKEKHVNEFNSLSKVVMQGKVLF